MVPFSEFEKVLQERFEGALSRHSHKHDERKACAIECAHVAMGDGWTDVPDRWPDIRPINDAPWSSDALRTEHMARLMRAYWGWAEWPEVRKRAVVTRIVLFTVQRVVPYLPGLSQADMRACREASTLSAAEVAALAAECAAYRAARGAARSAAEVAALAAAAAAEVASVAWAARVAVDAVDAADAVEWAARAAARAARMAAAWAEESLLAEHSDAILIRAVDLWIEAAEVLRASVSFPPDIYRTLEKMARQKKVSLAWVVREAAEKYVADQWPLFGKVEREAGQ